MKKYFRFFGIALLATTLCVSMASCGDDDNNDDSTEQNNNNGNGNGNGNGGNGGNGSVNVDLNGVASYTTPQDSLVAYYGQSVVVVASQRSASWSDATSYSMYFPYASVTLPAATGQCDTSNARITFFTGQFYQMGSQAGDANMQKYADWLLKGNMSGNVTAFNSSSLTVSATATGLMYNQYQGFVDFVTAVQGGAEQTDELLAQCMAAAPTANMSITINNVTLRNMNTKAFVKGTPRM